MVAVRVTHALYDSSILVDVPATATLLTVRQAVLSKAGTDDLNDVILVARSNQGFEQLRDHELLQDHDELLALGCNSVFPPDPDEEAAPSTAQLINEGRAVDYRPGSLLQVGQTIRVAAGGWRKAPGEAFHIQFLNSSGDIALKWLANEEKGHVLRNSRISNLAGSDIPEFAGGWPCGKATKDLYIDFELAPTKWKVSVNGTRLPAFDYAHRVPADISNIECSQNLIDPTVILITRSSGFDSQTYRSANPGAKSVKVTHAFYGTSLVVPVPHKAYTFGELRKHIRTMTKASSVDELLLVQSVGHHDLTLEDRAKVGKRSTILAVGSNLGFRVQHSSELESDWAKAKVANVTTSELLRSGQALPFPRGHAVCEGETIRVEANGWDNYRPATRYNSFMIELMDEYGDVAFHWGARFERQQVFRSSCVVDRFSLPETAGGWPHRQPSDRLVVDFMRTQTDWRVSVDGVRQPLFDFAHRSNMEVTQVRCSDNLRDAEITLCAPLAIVKVTHAIHGESVKVSVPPSAKLSDVRKRMLSSKGGTLFQDFLFVEKIKPGHVTSDTPEETQLEFVQLAEDELVGDRRDLLAVSSVSGVKLPGDTGDTQVDVAHIETSDLLKTGRATMFPTGRAVQLGETIRVEASGWDEQQPASEYNSFMIDLNSTEGDIILHWGARFHLQRVVRNVMINGIWSTEDAVGGWPHGAPSAPVRIDFIRTEKEWQVSIDGRRAPKFDFAHRSNLDVTDVTLSRNLYDAQTVLIAGSGTDQQQQVASCKVKTSMPPYKMSSKATVQSRKVRARKAAAQSGAGAVRAAAALATACNGTPLMYTVADGAEVPVLASPSEDAPQIDTLQPGDTVVGFPGGPWLRIVEFNEQLGWAFSESGTHTYRLVPQWASPQLRRTLSGAFAIEWPGIRAASTYSLTWRDAVRRECIESTSPSVIIKELVEDSEVQVLITANLAAAQGNRVRVSGVWCKLHVPSSSPQDAGCETQENEQEEYFTDADGSFCHEGDTTFDDWHDDMQQELVETVEHNIETEEAYEEQHIPADSCQESEEQVETFEHRIVAAKVEESSEIVGPDTTAGTEVEHERHHTLAGPSSVGMFEEMAEIFDTVHEKHQEQQITAETEEVYEEQQILADSCEEPPQENDAENIAEEEDEGWMFLNDPAYASFAERRALFERNSRALFEGRLGQPH